MTYSVEVRSDLPPQSWTQGHDTWVDAYVAARALKHINNTVLLWSSTGDLWEIENNGYRRVGF